MSETMIERVAVAIEEAYGDSDYVELHRAEAIKLARAAIEAMREPTQAMVDACDINIPTEGMITGVWNDMIEAALK
jgi:hypothetical protein